MTRATLKVNQDQLFRVRKRTKKGDSRNDTIARLLDLEIFNMLKPGDMIGFDTYKEDREEEKAHYRGEVKETKHNRILIKSYDGEPDRELKAKRIKKEAEYLQIVLIENGEEINKVSNLETDRFI